MIKRINRLLLDDRTHKMMETAGYQSVVYILEKYKSRLANKGKLCRDEIKYVEKVEKDIQTIDPHIVKMIVNGEEHDVYLYTKGA